ncbi:AMP-binding protein [Mycobacterium syngnathidarum]
MASSVPRAIPAELRRLYVDSGWWANISLGRLLSDGLTGRAELCFEVHSDVRAFRGTFGDIERTARRLAAGLQARGIAAGDVVAFQLPNWMEAAATFWASALLGATIVPIVHFYGRKELGYILRTTRPKVFITAPGFGRMQFHADLCADVPLVALVGEDFDELLADEPLDGTAEVNPDAPALIAFTSGTTRNPKGVVHSHQTLACEVRQLAANHPENPAGQIMALPVGHFIGMLGGLLCPVLEGVPIHLCDTWEPAVVLNLMRERGVGFGGGPTYFITSLLDHPDFTDEHLPYMRHLGLGGSAVPIAVTRRLTELGLVVTRSYGSTEHPSITGSHSAASLDKRLCTDGAARTGVEIRVADDGEILSRGPDLCIGYLDPELTAAAFDQDGWYHTGDVGVLDDDGYLTITDRKADVIIRGGENISAVEVEDILLTLPQVAEAIVVAAPDPKFGERVVAVLRLRPGQSMPHRDEVRHQFAAAGVARQKWPEDLREVTDFPRTASGKVQKYLVRQSIRDSHVQL